MRGPPPPRTGPALALALALALLGGAADVLSHAPAVGAKLWVDWHGKEKEGRGALLATERGEAGGCAGVLEPTLGTEPEPKPAA